MRTNVQAEIESRLRALLIQHLNKQLPNIEKACKQILDSAIKLSPTYQSLRSANGQLRQELGIEHPEVIDQLMQIWVDSLRATLTINRRSLVVTVQAVKEYSDLIKVAYHPFASYQTDKGATIEFMRWLLFVGTQPVVEDYYVKKANSFERQYSRTDSLIMRAKKGGVYRIPSEDAGTQENNFITRVCEQIGDEILQAIKRSL